MQVNLKVKLCETNPRGLIHQHFFVAFQIDFKSLVKSTTVDFEKSKLTLKLQHIVRRTKYQKKIKSIINEPFIDQNNKFSDCLFDLDQR